MLYGFSLNHIRRGECRRTQGDLRVLRIEDETRFDTYVAFRKGVELSSFAEHFIEAIRAEMEAG